MKGCLISCFHICLTFIEVNLSAEVETVQHVWADCSQVAIFNIYTGTDIRLLLLDYSPTSSHMRIKSLCTEDEHETEGRGGEGSTRTWAGGPRGAGEGTARWTRHAVVVGEWRHRDAHAVLHTLLQVGDLVFLVVSQTQIELKQVIKDIQIITSQCVLITFESS